MIVAAVFPHTISPLLKMSQGKQVLPAGLLTHAFGDYSDEYVLPSRFPSDLLSSTNVFSAYSGGYRTGLSPDSLSSQHSWTP